MAVSMKEALNIITKLQCRLKSEIIPIEKAQGRICAKNIKATSPLPKFNNSAMDGYGIIYEDKQNELDIISTILAGDDTNILLGQNQCVKIMTGAKTPSNCTAIIPKEYCKVLDNEKIKIPYDIKKLQHMRFIGEDIKEEETILKIGDEIDSFKITLLSSQGLSHIKVYKKPKVVVFSSGEELKPHYEKAKEYQIYNSNTPTFISRCIELGCDVNFIGQTRDSIQSIKSLIKNSLDANLIITSGGMSVGDADFTKAAFAQLEAKAIFEEIMIKPGKPTVLSKIRNTYILNLPGNPLASALIFELFGKILIQKLIGSNKPYHNYILTKIAKDLKNKKGRIAIIPGEFNGETFIPEKKRSPGMVNTLSKSNSLMVLHEDVSLLQKNKQVKILPIKWKFFEKYEKDFLTYE